MFEVVGEEVVVVMRHGDGLGGENGDYMMDRHVW